ncbi:FeoA family protein [Isoptericola sp. b441]|uniref:FeoA family protein n=1 Tax=Actinotalea lenta TaxID=3064654 RepID=A0ABT9D991_9CELL|nr:MULTISPECIES: FeoA family protein [unclassified Isoptericola]MDO8107460.1 FeoA family protein [Isoptericola sp. b441]MDO8120879.1 FeoA family protein [Isoptericola sp. b490]
MARRNAPADRLARLRTGDAATVAEICECDPAVRCRLRDLGITAGAPVVCVRRAPFGSPVVYRIGESDLCLRSDLAELVVVR